VKTYNPYIKNKTGMENLKNIAYPVIQENGGPI
jgi:hypothetical protein